ncbi:hypothetical protein GAYE_SCF05G2665 [Galdieria yellowstonensis]|uniref:GOLD domain-containing protein n=1 Tax=Galdieria yellowstonensis TaxID=3028027 RepID=A0AAV9IBS1_9RHOD|nr:hypothetical protein GAYE_SCF05G2665 [Galdieria yellowstonensis]
MKQRLVVLCCVVFACLICTTNGFAFYLVPENNPSSPLCFLEDVFKDNRIYGFFFIMEPYESPEPIHFEIRDPEGFKVRDELLVESKIDFVAEKRGVYEFCFDLGRSTNQAKKVAWDIRVDRGMEATANNKEFLSDAVKPEHLDTVKERIHALSEGLARVRMEQTLAREQGSTMLQLVESNRTRVTRFTLLECLLVIVVCVAEVFILRRLFEVRTKL